MGYSEALMIQKALVTIARAFVFCTGYKAGGIKAGTELMKEFRNHEA
jgi:hypothetical protein